MIEKKLLSKIFLYSTLICVSQCKGECSNNNINTNGNNGNNGNNQPNLSELVSIIKNLKTFTSTEIQPIDADTRKKLVNSLIKNKNDLNNIASFLTYGNNEDIQINEEQFVKTLKEYEEDKKKKKNINENTKKIVREGIKYHRKEITKFFKFLDNQDTSHNGINIFINELNESIKQQTIKKKLIYLYVIARINTTSPEELKGDNIVKQLSNDQNEINFTIDYYLNPKFNINNI